ncbi:MAG: pyridoxamine 5'-phosphate oxidase family protein [Rhizobiales bacterium]|nr:pyridoxamine 5'-phosphate oxidase family protein [Hyphomicrobiales bacterium]
MSNVISSIEELRKIYKAPSGGALGKQLARLDSHSRRFIELSPFVCLGTSRPDGLGDVSPRGGEPGFVHVLDETTLALPDRPGNNRLDTLENIIQNPAVGLLFFLPGFEEMLRINGEATLTTDPDLMTRFTHDGKAPRSVMTIAVKEVYLHCTKAIRRAALWDPAALVPRDNLPSFGEMLRDQMKLEIPADGIDTALKADAEQNLY